MASLVISGGYSSYTFDPDRNVVCFAARVGSGQPPLNHENFPPKTQIFSSGQKIFIGLGQKIPWGPVYLRKRKVYIHQTWFREPAYGQKHLKENGCY